MFQSRFNRGTSPSRHSKSCSTTWWMSLVFRPILQERARSRLTHRSYISRLRSVSFVLVRWAALGLLLVQDEAWLKPPHIREHSSSSSSSSSSANIKRSQICLHYWSALTFSCSSPRGRACLSAFIIHRWSGSDLTVRGASSIYGLAGGPDHPEVVRMVTQPHRETSVFTGKRHLWWKKSLKKKNNNDRCKIQTFDTEKKKKEGHCGVLTMTATLESV